MSRSHRRCRSWSTGSGTGSAGRRSPPPAAHWDPLVVDAYTSAQVSGQRAFYEPTDVTLLRYGCEAMHRSLHGAGTRSGTGLSPMLVREVVNIFGLLMFSEADRRRLRIELARGEKETPHSVIQLAEYRRKLSGGAS